MQQFTPPTSLTDGFVTLRPWHDDDAEAIVRRINDPDVAIFLDLVPQPYTLADAREWFAISKEGWRAGHRKERGQFSNLNERFDLSSMSEDAPLIGHHRRRQNRRE